VASRPQRTGVQLGPLLTSDAAIAAMVIHEADIAERTAGRGRGSGNGVSRGRGRGRGQRQAAGRVRRFPPVLPFI